MKIKMLVCALLVVAALFALFVYGSRRREVPPRVTEGAGWLRVVSLDPVGLTIRHGASWAICHSYEARVLEEGGAKLLLLRGVLWGGVSGVAAPKDQNYNAPPQEHEYSDRTFAVALDGSFAVREAARYEWERARELTDDERHPEWGWEWGQPTTRKVYSREGKAQPEDAATPGGPPLAGLEAGGAEWSNPGWLMSQGGRYVAAYSHTSHRRLFKRPNLIPFLGGEDDRISYGLMYVDVFDGPTGRRLARAVKGHRGSYDMVVFDEAVWFEGRYFAMPLDHARATWLFGVFPG